MQDFNFEPQFNTQFSYAPNFHFTFPDPQNPYLNFNYYPNHNEVPIQEEITPAKTSSLQSTSKKISKASPLSPEKTPGTKARAARNLWKPHEDEMLLRLVAEHGPKWTLIGKMIGGRVCKQVRDRYLNNLTLSLYQNFNENDFYFLAPHFFSAYFFFFFFVPHRSNFKKISPIDKQINLQLWYVPNMGRPPMKGLRPNINNGPFVREEDEQLAFLYQELGPKWRKIADSMPGRTESQVKNRFYMCLKDRLHNYKVSSLTVKKNQSASSQSTIESEACASEAISPDFNALNRKESLDFGFISYNKDNTKQAEDDEESLDCQLNFGRVPSYRLEGL